MPCQNERMVDEFIAPFFSFRCHQTAYTITSNKTNKTGMAAETGAGIHLSLNSHIIRKIILCVAIAAINPAIKQTSNFFKKEIGFIFMG